jgi:hypothetical protein
VHDYRANSDLLRCVDHAHERIVEECRADSLTLLADIDGQPGKDRDWDREVLR